MLAHIARCTAKGAPKQMIDVGLKPGVKDWNMRCWLMKREDDEMVTDTVEETEPFGRTLSHRPTMNGNTPDFVVSHLM